MNPLKRFTPGFTLIELIIYVGLLVLLILSIVGGIVQLTPVFAKARSERRVSLAAATVLERIVREVRLARSMSVNGQILTLESFADYNAVDFTSSTNWLQKKFCILGTQIMFDNGNGAGCTAPLTSLDVSVTNLTFTMLNTSAGSKSARSPAVNFRMTISSGVGKSLVSHIYSGTAEVRGNPQLTQ